jgi:hypothetical protein
MKKLLGLLLTFQFLLALPALAQEEDDDLMKNTWNDLYIVAGAGVGGGILGLSTLSFVEEPSEHLANIWTGAAIGVIVGVIYVAYSSAIKAPEELSGSIDFNSHERFAWHRSESSFLTPSPGQIGTDFWSMNF